VSTGSGRRFSSDVGVQVAPSMTLSKSICCTARPRGDDAIPARQASPSGSKGSFSAEISALLRSLSTRRGSTASRKESGPRRSSGTNLGKTYASMRRGRSHRADAPDSGAASASWSEVRNLLRWRDARARRGFSAAVEMLPSRPTVQKYSR
jgi:hypothetical protein